MKISNSGINTLKHLEGAIKIGDRYVVYDDATGRPVGSNEPLPHGATIGFGHLVKSGENFKNGITEMQATEILRSDISTAECAVKDNITAVISQNQYDALVIFAYNVGAKNFADSTVVKYINNPDFHSSVYPNLESAWKTWNRYNGAVSDGLVSRRQHEWNMYSRGTY